MNRMCRGMRTFRNTVFIFLISLSRQAAKAKKSELFLKKSDSKNKKALDSGPSLVLFFFAP
jgi:hypothetical protein